MEIGIWLETLERSGKVLREHEEKISLARAQHEEIEEELEQIAVRIEQNYRETNDCTAQMDVARNEAADLDGQAVRTEGEIGLLRNEISHNSQDVRRLQEQIEAAAASGEDIVREIAGKQAEITG